MTLEERLFRGLFSALKAKNEAEDEETKKEKEKAENEDVDKNDIDRQIEAIAAKSADDFEGGLDEKPDTIKKLLTEVSYDKSSRGTADNKAKNNENKNFKGSSCLEPLSFIP